MATAQDVLKIAAGEIGYSRWADPEKGTKYGRWYAQHTKQAWYGNNGVAYCAMFVSWVFNKAGMKPVGGFGAYCPLMLNQARAAGKVISKKNARAGDIVFFDWDGGVVDHVGIVEKNLGTHLQTIEGNTSTGSAGSQDNGGKVARRTRAWSVISAIVRPDYSGAVKTAAQTAQAAAALAVDGDAGKLTVTALQKFLKSSGKYSGALDGVLSNQNKAAFKKFMSGFSSVTFGMGGSQTVRGLQALTGATVDGYAGQNTARKLQEYLNRNGAKLTVDGYAGVKTVKALQTFLNGRKVTA